MLGTHKAVQATALRAAPELIVRKIQMQATPKISLGTRILMLVTRPRMWAIIRASRMARQNEVTIETDLLWNHALAGGDARNLVDGISCAKDNGIELGLHEMQAIDLIGVSGRSAIEAYMKIADNEPELGILDVARSIAEQGQRGTKGFSS